MNQHNSTNKILALNRAVPCGQQDCHKYLDSQSLHTCSAPQTDPHKNPAFEQDTSILKGGKKGAGGRENEETLLSATHPKS